MSPTDSNHPGASLEPNPVLGDNPVNTAVWRIRSSVADGRVESTQAQTSLRSQ
jgi:hypothetical protein